MGQTDASGKIRYQKPEVLDLGGVTPFQGGLLCSPTGSTASSGCTNGGVAGVGCGTGSTAKSIVPVLGPRVP